MTEGELPVDMLVMRDEQVIEVIYGSVMKDSVKVGDRYDTSTPLPNGKKILDGYLVITKIELITKGNISNLKIYADKFDY